MTESNVTVIGVSEIDVTVIDVTEIDATKIEVTEIVVHAPPENNEPGHPRIVPRKMRLECQSDTLCIAPALLA